jgi:hypothetical protein
MLTSQGYVAGVDVLTLHFSMFRYCVRVLASSE